MIIATTNSTDLLLDRIANHEHLAPDEWLRVINETSTVELQRLADSLRNELHPDNVVTYVVDRNINYSNVCFSVCTSARFIASRAIKTAMY